MALPIKPTPILRGKDAERFERDILRNATDPSRKVSQEHYSRAMKTYSAVMKRMDKKG
jgi:hypothetical protein